MFGILTETMVLLMIFLVVLTYPKIDRMTITLRMLRIICFAIPFLLLSCSKDSTVPGPGTSLPNLPNIDINHTRSRQAGPMYWTPYAYNYANDKHIDETRWKENIDWVAANFAGYGYEMICNDGHMEGAQTVDDDGYITKLHSDWQHDIAYWADYIHGQGLKLGISYNPLWMTKAAYDQNVLVKDSTVYAREIVGSQQYHDSLYFVDAYKDGAKEWIQGYVNYFKDLGAVFLRIDGLAVYEDAYGSGRYETALIYLREACGDDMYLSLAMPNCFKHCETELVYGDMLRVSDDTREGDWGFVSERRRDDRSTSWPQYGNLFDGFIGFSDIGGIGQMVLDGDVMRLSQLATDDERKAHFSLNVLNGSALAIADQYNTCNGCESIYQNDEMLELHRQALVAKPLSQSTRIEDAPASSRWAGQLPNGDWIVGLFNRENTPQSRSIDLQNELGLENGTDNIRDLWAQSDIGPYAGTYSTTIPPHACQILRIASGPSPKYEAEVASMINGTHKETSIRNYSGPGYVTRFGELYRQVLFAVEMGEAGEYSLNVGFANSYATDGTGSVYVNDAKATGLIFPRIPLDTWAISQTMISLEAGINYISIQTGPADNGSFRLDYIQVVR